MDISFFTKKLFNSINNKKKIVILGRGFSTAAFLDNFKKKENKNLIIGFNTDEIVDVIDFYFTNKKKLPINLPEKKLISVNDLLKHSKKKTTIFKVGSIIYSIDPLLIFLNDVDLKIGVYLISYS